MSPDLKVGMKTKKSKAKNVQTLEKGDSSLSLDEQGKESVDLGRDKVCEDREKKELTAKAGDVRGSVKKDDLDEGQLSNRMKTRKRKKMVEDCGDKIEEVSEYFGLHEEVENTVKGSVGLNTSDEKRLKKERKKKNACENKAKVEKKDKESEKGGSESEITPDAVDVDPLSTTSTALVCERLLEPCSTEEKVHCCDEQNLSKKKRREYSFVETEDSSKTGENCGDDKKGMDRSKVGKRNKRQFNAEALREDMKCEEDGETKRKIKKKDGFGESDKRLDHESSAGEELGENVESQKGKGFAYGDIEEEGGKGQKRKNKRCKAGDEVPDNNNIDKEDKVKAENMEEGRKKGRQKRTSVVDKISGGQICKKGKEESGSLAVSSERENTNERKRRKEEHLESQGVPERKKRKTREMLSKAVEPSKKGGHEETKKFVGAHVSVAGGLEKAVSNAIAIGARSFGLFLRSQRQWSSKPLEESTAIRFREACTLHNFPPHLILPHGSYLLNCGAPDKEILEKSRLTLVDELQRCEKLGLHLYNFHPGSTCGRISVDECLDRIAETINQAHLSTKFVITVIENMSCQGHTVGGKFSELRTIIDRVKDKSRVGVCLDTCHAFAAGYDIKSDDGYERTMAEFEEIIGFKYLKALHLNDSRGKLGCNLDRHENIGRGCIGLDGFKRVMNDVRFNSIPMILETPANLDDSKEIEILYSLCN